MRLPRSLDRDEDFIVYLSPKLLDRPDDEVAFTIAHELAHVILGHEEEPSINAAEMALQGEQQADELVVSWGFTIPPLT